MAILEKEILVKLNSNIIYHYETIGYDIPRRKDNWGNISVPKGTKLLVKVNDLPIGSNVKLTKICDICSVEIPNQNYQSILKSRKNDVDSCKKCKYIAAAESRRSNVKYEKSLDYYAKNNNKSHLLDEFNEGNKKKPNEISYGSKDEYLWDCKQCESTYSASVNNRTKGRNTSCPYCAGQKVNHTNCLLTTHPDISLQWHKTLNENLTPSDVSYGSNEKVWWICEKEHEWEATVNNRINLEQNCPYCDGRKASLDNCLAVIYPDLSKQWHPTKNNNLTPYDITTGSGKKVWWLGKCGHEWNMVVYSRSKQGQGCPKCAESKGEKKIREVLEAKNINYMSQFEFDKLVGLGGKNLKFDFAIINPVGQLIFLIEYDGEFHFKKQYENDNHEILINHDQRKNRFCKESNIQLVRIPYWELSNVDYIINQFLNHFKMVDNSDIDEKLINKFLVNQPEWAYENE